MTDSIRLAKSIDLDEFTFRLPAFVADPYPFYARLRAEDPVHYDPSSERWLLSRYADIVAALTDNRLKSSMPDEVPSPPQFPERILPKSMLFHDGPDHTRLRTLVNKAFAPRMIERMRPHIERIVAELLDRLAGQGRMDIVNDLAIPLPATVIAEMLGVPLNDQDRIVDWSIRTNLGFDASQPTEVLADGVECKKALIQYFAELVERRRVEPQADIISELIAAEEQGDRLSMGELLSTLLLLMLAGHDAPNLISGGMLALLQHPDQVALLRAHPELLPGAVEELLRYCTPVQRIPRAAHENLEIGGKRIERGQVVTLLLAAGNRDPEVFSDPERLDVTRNPNPHIAFNRGSHFCLGASLARLQAEVAFDTLLQRFPKLALLDAEPQWSPITAMRGPLRLPVSF